jgi:anaerobic ribonucleoside-triphosphate reductase
MQKKIICHDCGKVLAKNDEFMVYKYSGKEYFKCKSCHQKDSVLRNFQKAEVYSRVVGYIRPVEQWNDGKRTEFGDRVEFTLENSANC